MLSKERFKKSFKFAVFIAVFIFFISSFPLVLNAENLEDQLNEIKNEKEETKKKVDEAKKEEEQYLSQVSEIEETMLSSLEELEELNKKLSQSKIEIAEIIVGVNQKEKEILELEEELNKKTDILNKRIRELYKRGSRSALDVIFKSVGFLDFFTRLKMVASIAAHDSEIIKEIKEQKQLLIESKRNILEMHEAEINQKRDLEKLIEQEEKKNTELENIYSQKKDLLTVATANKEALLTLENQLDQKQAEIGRVLESYSYGSAPSGRLLWPVMGKLSSGFGNRKSYSGKVRFHAGIDIWAPSGTPIYAAESGQVIKAEYHGGYGHSILVYHGGNFATFYAHLSGYAISIGQNVQKGQVIGYVGTTGYTTGPHLHFEVRVNGSVKNPLNYF